MIVTVILGVVAMIASRGWDKVRLAAELRAVRVEARHLYDAFQDYYAGNYRYPSDRGKTRFNTSSFAPLRYQGNLAQHLEAGRIQRYGAPDDRGPDQEFWAIMTLELDSRYQYIVASSDDAPRSGGRWIEGVEILKDGRPLQGYSTD